MRLSVLAPLALLPAALGQSSSASASASASAASSSSSGSSSPAAYLQEVLGALTGAGLTSLVTVAGAIANTSDGMALLSQLGSGNKTVFAPNNDAFSGVSSDVSSNTTLLTQILSYHILNNTYSVNGTRQYPNHTIARTLLKGGGYQLPGNFSAPLVLSKNSTNATSFNINTATNNITLTGPASAANLQVYMIDQVIPLPPAIGDAVTTLLPTLAGAINATGLLEPLAASEGITVFAPSESALGAAGQLISSLNTTQLTEVLANHVINGSVVYSTGLASGNYTSAGGSPFTFTSNSTGAFVTSGNSTAQIIQSDIIIANGVVHVIDGVLANTNSNTSAAAAAYSSGIAAAATSTEATGAVTQTSSPATQSASHSASGGSGAGFVAAPLPGSFFAVAAAAVGGVIGGGLLLL